MIEARQVYKSYGQTVAVNNVSFSIGKGEILGLLGPNGAGKTTLMKVLTGYHYPGMGSVTIGGRDILEEPEAIKGNIGYLPENAPLYNDLNVSEYLEFIFEVRGMDISQKKEVMASTIEICGLAGVVYKPIEQLSKGYRQRVGLAQAIIHNPDILILDEPTTGLDPNQILEIRKLITRLGSEKTVILSTHILQEVEAVCTRVLIMNKGEIVASGTTDEISGKFEGGAKISVLIKGKAGDAFRSGIAAAGLNLHSEKEKGENTLLVIGSPETAGDLEELKEAAAEAVFDAAVAAEQKILGMNPVESSLEEVFVQLTGAKEGGDE